MAVSENSASISLSVPFFFLFFSFWEDGGTEPNLTSFLESGIVVETETLLVDPHGTVYAKLYVSQTTHFFLLPSPPSQPPRLGLSHADVCGEGGCFVFVFVLFSHAVTMDPPSRVRRSI